MAAVVLFHQYPKTLPFLDGFYYCGWAGVDVFFVLSGFLITTLLMREANQTGGISLRLFWTRRFLRLFPAWAISMLISVGIAYRLSFQDPKLLNTLAKILPYNLLGVANFAFLGGEGEGLNHVMGHYWSLAVEEHFYLVWPIIFLLFHRKPKVIPGIVVTGLVAAIFIRYHYLFGPGRGTPVAEKIGQLTQTRFDSLAWGCGLALVIEKLPLLSSVAEGLLTLLALGLFWVAVTTKEEYRYVPSGVWNLFGYSVLAFSVCLILWVVVKGPAGWARRALSVPLLTRGGEISYNVYLIHLAVVVFCAAISKELGKHGVTPGPYPFIFICFTASFVAGFVFNEIVDRRLEKFRARFHPPSPRASLEAGPGTRRSATA